MEFNDYNRLYQQVRKLAFKSCHRMITKTILEMVIKNSQRYMSGEVRQEFRFIIWIDDYHGQLGVGFDKSAHPIPKVCSFNIVIRQVSCGEDHTAFVVEPSG